MGCTDTVQYMHTSNYERMNANARGCMPIGHARVRYSMNCISGNLKIMKIMESTTPIINSRAGENSPYKQLSVRYYVVTVQLYSTPAHVRASLYIFCRALHLPVHTVSITVTSTDITRNGS